MISIPRKHECVSIGLDVIFPLKRIKHAPRSNEYPYCIPNHLNNRKNVIERGKGSNNDITRNSTGCIRCHN